MWYRLMDLVRGRGLKGLLRFVGTRIYRRRDHIVFSADRPQSAEQDDMPELPQGVSLLLAAGRDDLSRLQPHLASLSGEYHQYLRGIQDGEVVGVFILHETTLVHWAFLMRQSRMLKLLGEPSGSMLLGNAFTVPDYRGRGYQKASIRIRTWLAWRAGALRVVSETDPGNAASRAALQSAGLRPVGAVRVRVILNVLVVRHSAGRWLPESIGWVG